MTRQLAVLLDAVDHGLAHRREGERVADRGGVAAQVLVEGDHEEGDDHRERQGRDGHEVLHPGQGVVAAHEHHDRCDAAEAQAPEHDDRQLPGGFGHRHGIQQFRRTVAVPRDEHVEQFRVPQARVEQWEASRREPRQQHRAAVDAARPCRPGVAAR